MSLSEWIMISLAVLIILDIIFGFRFKRGVIKVNKSKSNSPPKVLPRTNYVEFLKILSNEGWVCAVGSRGTKETTVFAMLDSGFVLWAYKFTGASPLYLFKMAYVEFEILLEKAAEENKSKNREYIKTAAGLIANREERALRLVPHSRGHNPTIQETIEMLKEL